MTIACLTLVGLRFARPPSGLGAPTLPCVLPCRDDNSPQPKRPSGLPFLQSIGGISLYIATTCTWRPSADAALTPVPTGSTIPPDVGTHHSRVLTEADRH